MSRLLRGCSVAVLLTFVALSARGQEQTSTVTTVTATTTFGNGTDTNITSIPLDDASRVTFLTGLGCQASMTATSLPWQGCVAAYNALSGDLSTLNVLPQDGGDLKAGTRTSVAQSGKGGQGGSGGGGSKITGLSGPIGSVKGPQGIPEPGSSALLLSVGVILFVKRSSIRRLSNPRPPSSVQIRGAGNKLAMPTTA